MGVPHRSESPSGSFLSSVKGLPPFFILSPDHQLDHAMMLATRTSSIMFMFDYTSAPVTEECSSPNLGAVSSGLPGINFRVLVSVLKGVQDLKYEDPPAVCPSPEYPTLISNQEAIRRLSS